MVKFVNVLAFAGAAQGIALAQLETEEAAVVNSVADQLAAAEDANLVTLDSSAAVENEAPVIIEEPIVEDELAAPELVEAAIEEAIAEEAAAEPANKMVIEDPEPVPVVQEEEENTTAPVEDSASDQPLVVDPIETFTFIEEDGETTSSVGDTLILNLVERPEEKQLPEDGEINIEMETEVFQPEEIQDLPPLAEIEEDAATEVVADDIPAIIPDEFQPVATEEIQDSSPVAEIKENGVAEGEAEDLPAITADEIQSVDSFDDEPLESSSEEPMEVEAVSQEVDTDYLDLMERPQPQEIDTDSLDLMDRPQPVVVEEEAASPVEQTVITEQLPEVEAVFIPEEDSAADSNNFWSYQNQPATENIKETAEPIKTYSPPADSNTYVAEPVSNNFWSYQNENKPSPSEIITNSAEKLNINTYQPAEVIYNDQTGYATFNGNAYNPIKQASRTVSSTGSGSFWSFYDRPENKPAQYGTPLAESSSTASGYSNTRVQNTYQTPKTYKQRPSFWSSIWGSRPTRTYKPPVTEEQQQQTTYNNIPEETRPIADFRPTYTNSRYQLRDPRTGFISSSYSGPGTQQTESNNFNFESVGRTNSQDLNVRPEFNNFYEDEPAQPLDPNNKYWVAKCNCWKSCPTDQYWNYKINECVNGRVPAQKYQRGIFFGKSN